MKKKSQEKHTAKLKSQAVKLVVEDGKSVPSVAKQLSISAKTLSRWIKNAKNDRSLSRKSKLGKSAVAATESKKAGEKTTEVEQKSNTPQSPAKREKTSEGHLVTVGNNLAQADQNNLDWETLLDNARMQWQFGDWESLAELDETHLRQHPDREKLALLVATAWQNLNDHLKARRFISLAKKWGCDRKSIARLMVSSVHNTLGRAAACNYQQERAIKHFRASIEGVGGDARLACQARSVREMTRLGLLQQAADHINNRLNSARHNLPGVWRRDAEPTGRIRVLKAEPELLGHDVTPAHDEERFFQSPPEKMHSRPHPNEAEWRQSLQKFSASMSGQDLWVLDRTEFKRCGIFVEIGAMDGVLLSDTYLLERKFGWKGICVEPNPELFKQLKKNRTCRMSDQFIAAETGQQIEFIPVAVHDGPGSPEAKRAAGHALALTSISLDDFFKQHRLPGILDYLSIHIGGGEFEILENFPFDTWRIRLITVGHGPTPEQKKIRALLERRGYECTENELDDRFELKEKILQQNLW